MINLQDMNIQQKIADYLADERLDDVNASSQPVVYKDTLYTKYIKRILDIVISFIALILTLPLNLILGIITYIKLGSPLFFKQERIGRNEKPFTLVKFRNMTNATDKNGELLPAQQRLTPIGTFMRKTSLDELLNFWSVFKGDMSIIGPRALPFYYYDRFSDRHKARFKVKPGLECPPWDEKHIKRTWENQFENDVWYVEHVSFKVDCCMIFKLIRYTFDRKTSMMRAQCRKGSFLGYSKDGKAISNIDITDEEAEKIISEM